MMRADGHWEGEGITREYKASREQRGLGTLGVLQSSSCTRRHCTLLASSCGSATTPPPRDERASVHAFSSAKRKNTDSASKRNIRRSETRPTRGPRRIESQREPAHARTHTPHQDAHPAREHHPRQNHTQWRRLQQAQWADTRADIRLAGGQEAPCRQTAALNADQLVRV